MAVNKPFANLDRLSKLVTPTPKPFDFEPQHGSSKVRLDFAQNISLEDRTQQASLKTTNHLAQYFLSDQHLGLIKIKAVGGGEIATSPIQINNSIDSVNQGTIVLPPYNVAPNQGETSIRSTTIDSLLRQGASLSQGIYSSLTVVSDPSTTLQNTTRQGTFTTNQVTYSVITTENPTQEINQGSAIIKNTLFTPNQGSVNVTRAIAIETVEARQGVRKFNQKTVSSIEPATPTKDIEVVIPQAILIPKKVTQSELEVPSSIVIVAPSSIIEPQVPNSVTITAARPAGAFTDNQDVPIRTLGYLADKASNVLFPTLNHGGDLYIGTGPSPKEGFEPGTNNTETKEKTRSVIRVLSGVLTGAQLAAAIQSSGKEDTSILEYGELQNSRDPKLEDAHYFTVQTVQGVNGYETNPNLIYGKGLSATDTDDVEGFLSTYVRVSEQKGTVYNKERSSWNNSNGRRKYMDIANYSQLQTIVGQKESNPTQTNVDEYVVRLVSSNGKSASFTAFLTSFSDSFTANWTDYNHVGQMDTFKVYKGATRQLSVGFRVVAGLGEEFSNTPDDAAAAITKLNNLVNAAIVGNYNGNYVEGPIVTLTIVGLVKGIKCAIGSVKIDTDVAETSWTDGKPHVYSISLDAAVLSHNGDRLFSTTTTYLG